jgi:hypothetical protein
MTKHSDPEAELKADIEEALYHMKVQAEAKRLLAAESDTLREVEPTNERTMPKGPTYRIDRVLPAGGYALLDAQRKAGKTTAGLNVTRSLLYNEPLFGEYEPSVTRFLRVAMFDLEMSEGQFSQWLLDTKLFDEPRLYTENLRGEVKALGILDDRRRGRLARRLEDQGIDVLMTDPIGPLIRAYGMDENSTSVGELIDGLLTLTNEAGASELFASHHMGKDVSRGARGSSVLEDTPDALWSLRRNEKEGITTFGALGRDVDESAVLDYDPATRLLSVDGAGHVRSGKQTPILGALDKAGEPLSGNALLPLAKKLGYAGNLNTLNEDLRKLEVLDEVVNSGKPARPKWARKEESSYQPF